MTALALTDEQRRALDTRRTSVALDAGAGCGKTFVLTERFLSHLDPAAGDEPPSELSEVVAITFTEAAAREMRDRIRRRCRQRLDHASEAQRPFWRTLLRSLDAARVSTIHGFCGAAVRASAIELGIDPGFRVLDPAEALVLRGASVDDTLRARLLTPQREPDDEVVSAAAEMGLRPLREAVLDLSESAASPEFAAWRDRDPGDVVRAWRAFYAERVAPEYLRRLFAAPQVAELRALLDEATPETPGFDERVAALRDAFSTERASEDAQPLLQRLATLLASKDPETGRFVHTTRDWPDAATKKRFTAVCGALRKVHQKHRAPTDPGALRRAAEVGLLIHRLASESDSAYRDAKRAAGVLDTDDLLNEARRLLTDDAFAAARGRLSQGVRVLLVDEFQDTDRTQAAIVRALVGEGLDAGSPEADRGRLFFVGDFKQSIYRFRGAEPDVFRQLREATPAAGRLPLSRNFRSQPAVLAFVNRLFAGVFGDAYRPLSADREQLSPTPAVDFLWTPMPEAEAGERVSVDAQRRAEARRIAGRIRDLIEQRAPLVADRDGARPARPGDFALLFRALSDAHLYEDALREAGLDYYVVGNRAFYAQQEVHDLVHLLRCVTSHCDDIALAGVLRSPMFGLRDETLFWLAARGGLNAGLLHAAAPEQLSEGERARVDHARRVLRGLRRAAPRLATATLLERALDATGYDAALLAEFLGERKLANLDKLLEQARQSDAGGGDLRSFLRRLQEFINRPPKEALAATSPEDADVVRLMSVHRAKGLEFPIVVLPDLNRQVQSDRTSAAFHPELGPLVRPASTVGDGVAVGLDLYRTVERRAEEEESDRLFYVACTRAADRLILSSCLDDPAAVERLQGPWLKTLAERFDLTTGEVLDGGGDAASLAALAEPPNASEAPEAGKSPKTANLEKVLNEAERLRPGAPPAEAEPIAVDPADVFTFSVSRLTGRLRRVRADDDEDAERATGEEPTAEPIALGTLVHAVLERIDPAAAPADQIAAAERWSTRLAPLHARRRAAETTEEAVRLVTPFLATDRWRAMTAARLEREVEFLLGWPPAEANKPTAMIRGYLDALYLDRSPGGDGVWRIVDYKTNRVAAAGVAKLAEAYRLQMAVYALAAERALGVRPASLTLAFLSPGVEHDIAWGESERSRAVDEINAAIAAARENAAAAALRELTTVFG